MLTTNKPATPKTPVAKDAGAQVPAANVPAPKAPAAKAAAAADPRAQATASAVCAVCGGAATATEPYHAPEHEPQHIFGAKTIFICDVCGFGNTLPPVPDALLGEYYTTAGFEPRFFKRVEGGGWPFFDDRSVSQIMLGRLFVDFQKGDGFLDVGPGVGASFFSASQMLDEPKLFGVEMNRSAIDLMEKNIPGVTIVNAVPELDAAAKGVPLKLCVTSHCLEHYNGEGVVPGLREIHQRMAPGGVIVAEVPHWPLKVWNYRKNDVPHLCFFSQDALERAMRAGGFEVVYANVFGIPHKANKFYESERRKASKIEGLTPEGASFLTTINSGDFGTRPDGKLLRVVGRKAS